MAIPATRREALYSAAELYQKAGDSNNAIDRYVDYVQTYPQPFAQATGSALSIERTVQAAGAADMRRSWLQQIVETDATAGSARTDRSRFLAAQAQDELADELYRNFAAVTPDAAAERKFEKEKSRTGTSAWPPTNRCNDLRYSAVCDQGDISHRRNLFNVE